MQPIVPEYRRVLVDVLHREFHRGHDAAADVTLRHVIAVREEAGDVDVALLAAAEIDRLLADALADQQQPTAAGERGQQHRTTFRSTADRRGYFSGRPHPVPSSPLHPVNLDDISRCGRGARFHLVLIRVTGHKPDEKPRATLVAARPPTSVRMTEEMTLENRHPTHWPARFHGARIRDRSLTTIVSALEATRVAFRVDRQGSERDVP